MHAKLRTEFAVDSALEETGFEPLGPTSESTTAARPDVADPQHPSCSSNRSCQLNQHLCRKWDRRFESGFPPAESLERTARLRAMSARE
jgi:hypothetical protein